MSTCVFQLRSLKIYRNIKKKFIQLEYQWIFFIIVSLCSKFIPSDCLQENDWWLFWCIKLDKYKGKRKALAREFQQNIYLVWSQTVNYFTFFSVEKDQPWKTDVFSTPDNKWIAVDDSLGKRKKTHINDHALIWNLFSFSCFPFQAVLLSELTCF